MYTLSEEERLDFARAVVKYVTHTHTHTHTHTKHTLITTCKIDEEEFTLFLSIFCRRVNGRIPVIACGAFGGSNADNAQSIIVRVISFIALSHSLSLSHSLPIFGIENGNDRC
jgi:hypothetical protein